MGSRFLRCPHWCRGRMPITAAGGSFRWGLWLGMWDLRRKSLRRRRFQSRLQLHSLRRHFRIGCLPRLFRRMGEMFLCRLQRRRLLGWLPEEVFRMELLDLGRGSEEGLGSIRCSHDPWRFRVLVGAEELVGVESVILLNMKCSIEDQRRCEAGAECRGDK
ncbi:uncharacterized protein DS421_17g585050 [Arachis hypogaea]|nr:uncharacterized protein DS421_17g585050 [Arachis hypogaea]